MERCPEWGQRRLGSQTGAKCEGSWRRRRTSPLGPRGRWAGRRCQPGLRSGQRSRLSSLPPGQQKSRNVGESGGFPGTTQIGKTSEKQAFNQEMGSG